MFEKLAYVIVEAGHSGQQMSPLESRGCLLSEVSLPRGPRFSFVKPSPARTRPTHSMQGHQLYSESTDLNVSLI